MFSRKSFENKKCTVLGLGISNRPLISFLKECGAEIEARDQKTAEELGDYFDHLKREGVSVFCGDHFNDKISDSDFIFRSPGIRPDLDMINSAVAEGTILTSEIELFVDMCPCRIVGITGSDGKTTTSTITAKLLESAGKRVMLGGNIGRPLINELDRLGPDDVVVLELSSFQLMTFRRSPSYSAITNISENHLNWHTDMNEYIDSKANIFRHSGNDLLALNSADLQTGYYSSISDHRNIVTFSANTDADICLENGRIMYFGNEMLKAGDILLTGRHNIENYMTAMALSVPLGITRDNIISVAGSFKGVEHRMEYVGQKERKRFFNSSIDSTPTRTSVTLSAIGCKPIVICGGQDKHLSFDLLADSLTKHSKAVVITGEAKNQILDSLKQIKSELPVYVIDDFEEAVLKAYSIAKKNDTILLSPACTSFDRFKNFEERGNTYKNIVKKIIGDNEE